MSNLSMRVIAIAWLIFAANAAQALSLGRSSGAVLLGRGFDNTVFASVDAAEATPEASCFAAELFYGESRIAPASVQIGVERSNPSELRVRVRSSQPVDEPVATLYLRSTCGGGISSRRYVLLSDSPTEQASSSNPPLATLRPEAAPTAPVSVASSPAVLRTPAAPSARVSDSVRPAPKAIKRSTRSAKAADPAPSNSEKASKNAERRLIEKPAAAEASGSRLKLDLLDVSNLSPNLRGSFELLSAPSNDDATRAKALATWRSLNGNVETATADLQNLQALQAQMKASTELSKRQSQEIATLNTQLQEAKKSRFLNPWTIGLGLLALLGLAAAAFLWMQRSGSRIQPWWSTQSKPKTEREEAELWEHLETKNSPLSHGSAASNKLPAATKSGSAVNVKTAAALGAGAAAVGGISAAALTRSNSSAASSEKTSVLPVQTQAPDLSMSKSVPNAVSVIEKPQDFGATDFGGSTYTGVSRTASAEELFDIQEQADFFLSLGQPDQAIEVLKNHISDNVETSALAYMDLFNIYHRTQRRSEYNELREEFTRVFNAQVPEFDEYRPDSRGLEDYPLALSSIQDCWPDEGAIELIEESIFRKPDAEGKPFDMQAYRELMLLYSIAKDIENSEFLPLIPGDYGQDLLLPEPVASAHPASSATPKAPAGALSTSTNTDLAALLPLSTPGVRKSGYTESAHSAPSDSGLDLDIGLSFEASSVPLPAANQNVPSASSAGKRPTQIVDDNSVDFDLSDYGDSLETGGPIELSRLRNAGKK